MAIIENKFSSLPFLSPFTIFDEISKIGCGSEMAIIENKFSSLPFLSPFTIFAP